MSGKKTNNVFFSVKDTSSSWLAAPLIWTAVSRLKSHIHPATPVFCQKNSRPPNPLKPHQTLSKNESENVPKLYKNPKNLQKHTQKMQKSWIFWRFLGDPKMRSLKSPPLRRQRLPRRLPLPCPRRRRQRQGPRRPRLRRLRPWRCVNPMNITIYAMYHI